MKFLPQFCVILVFSFLGEVCHALIPFPIPASIYGMVLLFAALSCKLIRVEHIKTAGSFLVSILPVLFVPPAVGLMDYWDLLKNDLVLLILVMLVTTVLTFFVSGAVTEWIVRRKEKKHD